jgi:hypothetical protein
MSMYSPRIDSQLPTEFQGRFITAVEELLAGFPFARSPFVEVRGRNESYRKAVVLVGRHVIEIYAYPPDAEIAIDFGIGDNFERSSFPSVQQRVAAPLAYLRSVLQTLASEAD